MKKFFLYLFFVIFGVFFADLCFGAAMKSILKSTTKGDWGRRVYIADAINEDLLVFGASRAIHHYDTRILSDSLQMTCYNCGDDGMGIMVHLPRFKKIIQRYCPKVVVYEVAPQCDFEIYDNTRFLNVLRPFSEDLFIKEAIRDIESKELMKLHLNLYKFNSIYIDVLIQYLSRNPTTAQHFTYSPLISVMDYEPEPIIFKNIVIDTIKYQYLREFVDLCHENGIKLIFTVSPWYKMKVSDAYAPICKLCKEKGVTFLNHNFDSTFNYRKEYFHDAAHLNKSGAEAYTKVIAHEIKNIVTN